MDGGQGARDVVTPIGQGGAGGAADAPVGGAGGPSVPGGRDGSADRGGTGGAGGGGGRGGSDGGVVDARGLPPCVGMDDERAPFVAFQRTDRPAPAPLGGAIAGGTYFLTNLTYHGGTQILTPCALSLVHEVLRFTARSDSEGTMHSTQIDRFADGSGRTQRAQEKSYRAQGSTLTGRYTCWQPYTSEVSYTATGNQIRFIVGPFDSSCDKGVTLVRTYERQP